MSISSLRKIFSIASLAVIGHFTVMVPHTLCSSLIESSGHAVELAADSCPDRIRSDEVQHHEHKTHGSAGLVITENDDHHHHHHCDITVLASSESNTSQKLVKKITPVFDLPVDNSQLSVAVRLKLTRPQQVSLDPHGILVATRQFIETIRILS